MPNDIKSAQRQLNARVLGRPGISGTAIGEKGGRPCLKVYVSEPAAGKTLPGKVGGFPVVVEKSGTFRKL